MFTPKRPSQYKKYKNLGGKSTVEGYEVAKDGIIVRFTDRSEYRYTNQSTGPEKIGKMKTLATAGKGLGTYIAADVKDAYLRRVR